MQREEKRYISYLCKKQRSRTKQATKEGEKLLSLCTVSWRCQCALLHQNPAPLAPAQHPYLPLSILTVFAPPKITVRGDAICLITV